MLSIIKDLYTVEKEVFYELPPFKGENIELRNKKGDLLALLCTSGKLFVYPNYSFDGCTPKFKICNYICGVSDGYITKEGLPRLYHASLKHDVLCQFYKLGIPYSRKEIDKEFKKDLIRAKWEYTNLYYRFVRLYAILRGYK